MSPHRLLTLLVLVSALLLSGCASLSPDVGAQMTDLRFGQSKTLETVATVTLRVTNRGTKPLSVKGAAIKVYLNGELIGEGVSNQALVLEGLTSQEVPLEIALSHLSMAMRLQPVMEAGVLLYRIDGKLYQSGWVPAIPVSTTGRLDLRQFERPGQIPAPQR
jgi:LEA14-like dessication related protein